MLDFRTGREYVRVAHRLGGLPLVAAAFREGTISYSKVRALCRIANPGDGGRSGDVGPQWHGVACGTGGTRATAVPSPYPPRRPRRQYARRCVSWWWDDDGSFVLNARLPAEVGASVRQAITEAMDKSRAPHDERAADAFTEVIERALAVGPSGRPDRYR